MNYTEDILGLDVIQACQVYETVTEVKRDTDSPQEFKEKVLEELEYKYDDDFKVMYGGIIASMYEEGTEIKLGEEETEKIIKSVIDNVREEVAGNLEEFVQRILG